MNNPISIEDAVRSLLDAEHQKEEIIFRYDKETGDFSIFTVAHRMDVSAIEVANAYVALMATQEPL